MAASAPAKGLEGIVAATSSVCYIDGEKGVLAYRGIDIHELADHSTFEETCYLLWFGRLPSAKELEELRASLAAERKLDSAIFNLLRGLPPHSVPMEVLRTAVSEGFSPFSISRKFAEWESARSGATTFFPLRMRS